MIDEKILISKAKNGELDSFEEIIELYKRKVFSIIRYMIKNNNDIEDVAQDVFVKIYKNLKNFKEQSSLYTWVYRITVNVCIDYNKRQKKVFYIDDTIKKEDGEFDIQLEDTSKKPDEIVEGAEIRSSLQKCIQNLPQDQRIMIILRDIKGFTYMEIAEILRMNLGTVKSRINRARISLKELLIEDGTTLEYEESNK